MKNKIGKAFVNPKIFLITGVCFLLLIGFFFLFRIYYTWSAEYTAKKYFEVVIQNNPELTYQYLKDDEGIFVSKQLLEEKMIPLGKIDHYSISKVKKENGITSVEFSFNLDGAYTTATVELIEKKIGPFKKYKVKSGALAYDVEIRVLKGSKITIDEKEIQEFLSKKNEDKYYDVYIIPKMIKGNYRFQVSMPNGFEKDVDISIGTDKRYTLNKVNITEEEAQRYGHTMIDSLNILYQSAAAKKEYREISSNFSYNLERVYQSIQKSIQSDKKNISSIRFTNVQILSAMLNDQGNLEFDIFADYDMTYSYVENGLVKKLDISKYMSLVIEFIYQNDTFILSNISTSYHVK